ncbi:hypothetical protein A2W54_04665 [Candidatus Giovannonibacteria bacterium RIFCSPHIGHO2_02_43_13]|uniref:Uncharacterized protein n=1 Tax=Candidatus Giovannonibacteria bacterium RIFCSPHIGHO2_02_43_13 TaxID=1798330 RepID=A0A1F5WS20_9BACT|nr:MAG: hypothetical protein A3E06_01705 [Candidatus Giovannonibacteria bacterium RIFCSPHIGHO2_12_FULL_44_42]OGF78459.1 MAG: hypothetical protein A2W54_04665 [Candidatus Giovannonibacteria bacterium RIFCSPHIGHO2_02_43_13]OGF88641.1 MAG: hypothetical protein A3I94_03990 [Candidatus Giovannonibacteria bacterium RIFCSPLOWO2_02_FULL_43_54]OGF97556.1 MAG: hypothetical protein A3H08_00435 [Candidatus Giovannonibacteria bacterium RIFCSPLOWO2_12_FULL_44_32]
MKGLSLDFLMLLIGNIFLYQIFFWLIDVPGTKKLLGLQTDSLWLYTAYFSFISMFVAYPAVYLIHMAIVRQSLVNIDVKVIVMLIWLANPVALFISEYFNRGQLNLSLRVVIGFLLMAAAQVVMRWK